MDSPLSPTPVEGEQRSQDPSDSSQSSGLAFGRRRNQLPTRRLIDFEPLRQQNTTYQHGRDSPVWGQPLEPPDAPELPQPSFESEDPFLSTRRLVDYELFRLPDTSSLRDGQSPPVWGYEQFLEPPDTPALSLPDPPEYDIVYSNGWINEIPIHPMDYEYCMLPIQPSQHGGDSPVSRCSEPLSIKGSDPFQDSRKSKRGMTHGRSASIERACKSGAHELANSATNPNKIGANIGDLFDSLENLALDIVNNHPSTEAPPQRSVEQPPNGYIIRKRSRDEPPEPKVDVEDLPFWLRARFHLGIRLPPGMVNLSQPNLPVYLIRKLKDPLRYLPSELLFKENSPFGNVIPKKGQIGIHPTFRTTAPEDILEAERALELSKEPRFLTPVEAWRSPVIGDCNSDTGTELLRVCTPTTVDNRTSPTDKLQNFEQGKSENHSHRFYEESNKPASSDQLEAFPAFDEALTLSDQNMESLIEDQASIYLNQSLESPDIGSTTMFSGQDIEPDQGSIYLGQGVQYLDVVSSIEDHVAMAVDQGTESRIENKDPEENQDPAIENWGTEIENEDWEIGDQDSHYFGQGMEYLLQDVASRYFGDDTEFPPNNQPSVFSDHGMEYLDIGPPSMFYDQDIEYFIEDQDSMPSSASVRYSPHVHEDIPIVRWFFEPLDDESAPVGQPSSNHGKKTKKVYKRNSADFAHLPPIDFTKSYEHFSTTPFGKLMTGSGLEDYNNSNEETVEKTTKVTEDPLVSTQTYGPEDHETRMQELFADIELEGASRILTTWQEVYAERADEQGTEEEGDENNGAKEEGAKEDQAEIALEDTKENIAQEPAVTLERKRSKRKSWFGVLPAKKEDIQERRKSQGAESGMNGKRLSWLGGLGSMGEDQTQESSMESIGYVAQEPADLLVRKNSKRATWFRGLPTKRQERTEKAFGDSQEKIVPGTSHPLERRRSKRTSWLGGRPAEEYEPTKEDLEDNHGILTRGPVNPLERKESKRRSWFLGHSAEKVGQTKDNPEDNPGKLIQENIHPLERKGSRRRSWFPGHSTERMGQTKDDSEGNLGKSIQETVHPLERKGSKRRSWFLGQSAERVEQTKYDSEGNSGKLIQENIHPLERKGSKRRSWFPGHSTERMGETKVNPEDNPGNLIQENVHPLERKGSKRRSWFPGHSAERVGRSSEENPGKLIPGNVHPLQRKGSKRKSWLGRHPAEREAQSKEDLEDSYEKVTLASVHPLERKGSKRRSWFPGHPTETGVRTSQDSHEKSIPGHIHPLERKGSKRKSWFGVLHPEKEERTEFSFEDSHGKVTPEPVEPLERKRSNRKSWFGGVPAKRDEQTRETFELSEIVTGPEPADHSEQVRAKRVSWFGGLPTQKEKQTKKTTEDNHGNITQVSADPSELKRAKRASWFGGLPGEREKAGRGNPEGGEEERKRKRGSWFV
ncbi:hypothetical protein V496_06599 [Pseudogymnoascus sp. VKM F-4515 (FW-2607)]|nr:hypothetical protein V496_06599 [Pseudogymnoascus sp. VKM F-4515 (FW-2607)]KFY97111.1 hypothetical protein V498_02255 [Pseudogymnoascus sp. VKM F-4517 (FW-2822)]